LLNNKGFTLRSGAADGSDTEFESQSSRKEIFLPWKKFNGSESPLFQIPEEAFVYAAAHHPAWHVLPRSARNLMACNAQQVLGKHLKQRSLFVVCYTADGCESAKTRTSKTGGTGLAISIASSLHIPIFNLKNAGTIERLLEHVNQFIL
jgi:hypothetical protein